LEDQKTLGRSLRAIRAAALRLGALPDLEHTLQAAVSILVSDFDSALADVWLHEEATNLLHLRAHAGLSSSPPERPPAVIDVVRSQSKVGEVARTQTAYIGNDIRDDAQFDQDWVQSEKITAAALFPILQGSELRGVLAHFARQPLGEETTEALAVFAAIVTASINVQTAASARDRFFSIASHELRTPLSPIQLQVQLLLRAVRGGTLEKIPHERLLEMLEICDRQIKQLVKLIDDLLNVSRIKTI